jgi:hypothetical protein
MNVYENETSEIVRRFLSNQISFSDCVSMLNMALAGVIPELTGDQIPALRTIMANNTKTVMDESERRRHQAVKAAPVSRL